MVVPPMATNFAVYPLAFSVRRSAPTLVFCRYAVRCRSGLYPRRSFPPVPTTNCRIPTEVLTVPSGRRGANRW